MRIKETIKNSAGAFHKFSLTRLQSGSKGESLPPTNGGNDGTTEEEGRGRIPAAGEVGSDVAHTQAGLHRRHHALQGRQADEFVF